MCGICGFVYERRPDYDGQRVLESMADVIRHRGPTWATDG